MSYHKLHLVEKLQVQLSAAIGLAAVYFALWPIYRPADPHAPFALLAQGHVARLALVVLTALLAGIASTMLTLKSRPEGGLLVTLVTILGISLRSPQMRGLLWAGEGGLRLNATMIIEVVILAAVLVAVAWIIDRIRIIVPSRALWEDPISKLNRRELNKIQETSLISIQQPGLIRPMLTMFSPKGEESKLPAKVRYRPLTAGVLTLVGGLVLLVITLQSTDRGQIIFALAASFGLSALLMNQLLPTRVGAPAWISPMVAGILLYVLAAIAGTSDTPNGWINYPVYARILPLDWFGAGCGGAVTGFWISMRMHESRILENLSSPNE